MVRDFTYIDDVTEEILKLVISTKNNDIKNILKFQYWFRCPISLLKYVEIIEKKLGKAINYLCKKVI